VEEITSSEVEMEALNRHQEISMDKEVVEVMAVAPKVATTNL
jgi:hypothetical protein